MKDFGLLLVDIVWKAYGIGVIISAFLLYGMTVWECFEGMGFFGSILCLNPLAFFFSFYRAVFWPYLLYQALSP